MSETLTGVRIQNRYDTKDNWEKYNPSIKQGELIVYAPDDEHSYPRVKIGTNKNLKAEELPFIGGNVGEPGLSEGSSKLGAENIVDCKGLKFSSDAENNTQYLELSLPNAQSLENLKNFIISKRHNLLVILTSSYFYENVTITIDESKKSDNILCIKFDGMVLPYSSDPAKMISSYSGIVFFEKEIDTSNNNNTNIYNPIDVPGAELICKYSLAEGYANNALGWASHAEGHRTTAIGPRSHTEGWGTIAHGNNNHAEGFQTKTFASNSHAEGYQTTAEGQNSHTEGGLSHTAPTAKNSHAEGRSTFVRSENAHAEGFSSETGSFVFEFDIDNYPAQRYIDDNITDKYYLTSIDGIEDALDKYKKAILDKKITQLELEKLKVYYTVVLGGNYDYLGEITSCGYEGAHNEYKYIVVTKQIQPVNQKEHNYRLQAGHSYVLLPNHPELGTKLIGTGAHAEGYETRSRSISSHSEGYNTTAAGKYSHAEGRDTVAGYAAHAEGRDTKALGENAHSEGVWTIAKGDYSHAEGKGTVAKTAHQHVQGKFNKLDDKNVYADIIGNGIGDEDTNRSNASTVDWRGNAWFSGDVYVGGTHAYYDAASGEFITDSAKLLSENDIGRIGGGFPSDKLMPMCVNPRNNSPLFTFIINSTSKTSEIKITASTLSGIINNTGVTIIDGSSAEKPGVVTVSNIVTRNQNGDTNNGAFRMLVYDYGHHQSKVVKKKSLEDVIKVVHCGSIQRVRNNWDNAINDPSFDWNAADIQMNQYLSDNYGILMVFHCQSGTNATQVLNPENVSYKGIYHVIYNGKTTVINDKTEPLIVNSSVYVDSKASSGGNGSSTKPFNKIQSAIDSGAETLYVTPGIYKESITAENRNKLHILVDPSKKSSKEKIVLDYSSVVKFTNTNEIYDIDTENTYLDFTNLNKMFKDVESLTTYNNYNRTSKDGVGKGYTVNMWHMHPDNKRSLKYDAVILNSNSEHDLERNQWTYINDLIYLEVGDYDCLTTSNDENFARVSDMSYSQAFSYDKEKYPIGFSNNEGYITLKIDARSGRKYEVTIKPLLGIAGSVSAYYTVVDNNTKETIIDYYPLKLEVVDKQYKYSSRDGLYTFIFDASAESVTPDNIQVIDNSFVIASEEQTGVTLKNINNVYMENVEVRFSTYCGFWIENCSNVRCVSCDGLYSGIRNGFQIHNTEGSFERCVGNINPNDGFGISGTGYTSFLDCEAHYNNDDGISHHDNCKGSINGGFFTNNGKGGVSPAHGAVVNCYNVSSNSNKQNGFYMVDGQSKFQGRSAQIVNCFAKNNLIKDILVKNYHVSATNCTFDTYEANESPTTSLVLNSCRTQFIVNVLSNRSNWTDNKMTIDCGYVKVGDHPIVDVYIDDKMSSDEIERVLTEWEKITRILVLKDGQITLYTDKNPVTSDFRILVRT